MTIEDAKAKGYQLIPASEIEVGLLYKGNGVRTWWASDFHGKMPLLDHPLVQQAIEINEQYQNNHRCS